MREIVIGIDIGGTNTVFALIDREGNIIAKSSFGTDGYKTFESFIEELTSNLRKLLTEQDQDINLIGIGIGAPNSNYYKGTIDNAANLKWKGVLPVVEMLKSKFDLPAFLTNDANAAAIGEMVFGAAKHMKDFIVITLGTGLGSGFMVNGKLMYGSTSFAGELGHIIIENNGRQCGCGRKGCLETYVSSPGITITVVEILKDTKVDSSLRNVPVGDINSKLIYEAAVNNDKVAIEAFDYTSRLLGKSLADTVQITSPEAIFLFGGLALAGDFIIKPTEKYMNQYLMNNFKGTVKLMRSGIEENNAAVLGTAALVWYELK